MIDEENNARWQEILQAQADFVDEPPAPQRGSRRSADHRSASKSARFNEALSELGTWSSVQPAERRLSA